MHTHSPCVSRTAHVAIIPSAILPCWPVWIRTQEVVVVGTPAILVVQLQPAAAQQEVSSGGHWGPFHAQALMLSLEGTNKLCRNPRPHLKTRTLLGTHLWLAVATYTVVCLVEYHPTKVDLQQHGANRCNLSKPLPCAWCCCPWLQTVWRLVAVNVCCYSSAISKSSLIKRLVALLTPPACSQL